MYVPRNSEVSLPEDFGGGGESAIALEPAEGVSSLPRPIERSLELEEEEEEEEECSAAFGRCSGGTFGGRSAAVRRSFGGRSAGLFLA